MKCCDIKAGDLRAPVQFQRLTRTADGAGGAVETWEPLPFAPVRAKVEAMSGRERFASARVEATANIRVTCRYFAGLTEADAVTIQGQRCNIRHIEDVEFRHRWLVIEAERGVVGA